MEKTVKKDKEVQESGANGMEQRSTKLISIADTDELILQYNQMADLDLDWDRGAFRRLKPEVQEQLRADNLRRYVKAEIRADEEAKKAASVKVVSNPMNPITGYADYAEYIRPRKGWHQAWKNAGRDYEAAIMGPYKPVREPTEKQKKEGYEPGEESGEIKKRVEDDGNKRTDVIAVECPQEIFEQYINYMAEASSNRFTQIQETYAGELEQINRNVNRRDAKVIPMIDGKEV